MHAACEYGVLQFLHSSVLSSHCLSDEQATQRQLYASALHRLLIQFLNAARCVYYYTSDAALLYMAKAHGNQAMPVSILLDKVERSGKEKELDA